MDKMMQPNQLIDSLLVVMGSPVGLTASLVPGVSTTARKGSGHEKICNCHMPRVFDRTA